MTEVVQRPGVSERLHLELLEVRRSSGELERCVGGVKVVVNGQGGDGVQGGRDILLKVVTGDPIEIELV